MEIIDTVLKIITGTAGAAMIVGLAVIFVTVLRNDEKNDREGGG